MESKLDPFFKYKIGDFLQHVGHSTQGQIMYVVTRHLEECPGGIQAEYQVRAVTPVRGAKVEMLNDTMGYASDPKAGGVHHHLIKVNEIELKPWDLSEMSERLPVEADS